MQIVEYHDTLLPDLTRLINQQMAAIPPVFTLSEAQVAHIIKQGGSLWNIHYPENRELPTSQTLCILERREVVAAAQVILPKTEGGIFWILWLVAQPDHPIPLRTLLHLIDKQVQKSHCAKVSFARCSFGVGWFGIPTTWTHVLTALREAGYEQAQTWLLMQADTEVDRTLAAPQADGLRCYWNMNKPALEWELTAYQGDIRAGECQVWGIPPHLEGCDGAAEWITVEWVEVQKAYRRQGIGARLMADQMRFHSRRGVRHFVVWTGQRNRAARKLNESLGFTYGPKLAVMEKPEGKQLNLALRFE